MLVLFWAGTVPALVLAASYLGALAQPSLGGGVPDTPTFRTGLALSGALFAAICVLQLIAALGLTMRRQWGRVLATLVCVAWCITCVGLPLALLALNSIWRRPRSSRGAGLHSP